MSCSVPPLTIEEVRQFLLDRSPCDNRLLDAMEIDDSTIVAGMKHCIDLFNTTHPLVHCFDPTMPELFPYRSEMLMYCAYFCLTSKGINKLRNEPNVKTLGGTELSTTEGWKDYLAVANSWLNDVKAQFLTIKRNINTETGYRIVT
jgi:hypothetical protein